MFQSRKEFVAVTALIALAAIMLLVAKPAPTMAQDRDYLPPQQRPQGGSSQSRPYGDDAPRSVSPPPKEPYREGRDDRDPGYGQPYAPPRNEANRRDSESRYDDREGPPPPPGTYSTNEIIETGGKFFGKVSESLAKVVEYTFRRQGRPNGYILGEEAGGAIVAGLRYGEGTLYTKFDAPRKVYWQGPSIGYDFGGDGSKTLTLVYNLRDPRDIFERFGGVEGSAYLVGGVGVTFQQHRDITLAPIRSGVGLRLGANIGYLKYTPSPTWNPF